jgi:ABC-type nitrate/sulfonate/bicarbonate transport system substrate-binding protein
MIGLDALGIDPEKYDLKMRVVGDTATVTQALATGNIDAAILPYSFSEAAKRGGANVLADIGKLNAPYQGTTLCYPRELATSAGDVITRIIKGIVDAVVLIHDPNMKPEIMEILRRNFRFDKTDEAEASYRVLTLASTIEVAPSIPAWKTVQKIVNRINPNVGRVDLNQLLNQTFVRSLEESGFMAEARKKIK